MCQAICEDFERPNFSAPAQRITSPGEKPCSRKGVEQVGKLSLCKTHARLAREGFVAEDGTVTSKNDIREYREKFARRPGYFKPPFSWASELEDDRDDDDLFADVVVGVLHL